MVWVLVAYLLIAGREEPQITWVMGYESERLCAEALLERQELEHEVSTTVYDCVAYSGDV